MDFDCHVIAQSHRVIAQSQGAFKEYASPRQGKYNRLETLTNDGRVVQIDLTAPRRTRNALKDLPAPAGAGIAQGVPFCHMPRCIPISSLHAMTCLCDRQRWQRWWRRRRRRRWRATYVSRRA